MPTRSGWNAARFKGRGEGHYESWFQRANHPSRPLAFWIRYTIFVPSRGPSAAVGELWCILFDGETGEIHPSKREVPLEDCAFSREGLDVRIDTATLVPGALEGSTAEASWNLTYACDDPPLLLLPEAMYEAALPRAKALVGSPNARFSGTITVGPTTHEIGDWVGSQNHNWGSRHTDRYAWGQVAGFDDEPDAFLECGTARIKLGPIWSPWFTMLTLRLGTETYAVRGLLRAALNRGRYDYFSWNLRAIAGDADVRCHFRAPREAFVALAYPNPPGGHKTCLNSKIASCEMTVERPGKSKLHLATQSRAAFEILTDDNGHGLPHRA